MLTNPNHPQYLAVLNNRQQMFQLYNAYTLANIYVSLPDAEWQVRGSV